MEENKSTAAPQLAGEALMNEVIKKKKAAASAATNSTPAPKVQPQTQPQPPANENPDRNDYEYLTVGFGDFVRDFKPLQWLIYGYILKDALQMCFGPSGAGKSFVALDMALHVAVQKMIEDANERNEDPNFLSPSLGDVATWHGQITHGGRVLYVAGEGIVGMKKRALGWAQQYGFNPDALNDYFRFSKHSFHLDSEDMQLPNGDFLLGEWNKLLRELEALRAKEPSFIPDLIVFDTLKANMLGDENSAKEASFVIDRAQELVNGDHNEGHGATVLFIHHTGWGLEARGRERGSSAWRGAMDINLSVSHGVKTDLINGKTKQTHFAVIDSIKCKDDETQPRRYLERVSVQLVDENGFPIPSSGEEGKMETTLILKTVAAGEELTGQIKIDGEEERQPKRSGKKDKDTKPKGEEETPPANEESSPEDLTPDDLALPGMEEALSSASSGVKSFAQLKKNETRG